MLGQSLSTGWRCLSIQHLKVWRLLRKLSYTLNQNFCKEDLKKKNIRIFTRTSRKNSSASASFCPQSHPYAFKTGSLCCSSSMEAEDITYCPPGWSKFEDNCYKYFSAEKSWTDARKICVDHQVRYNQD